MLDLSGRSTLILSSDPKGHFDEGIIDGALKPGTLVQLKPATEADGTGAFTYRAWTGDAADGERDEVILLLNDKFQGKDELTAYASGDRCFLYFPVKGDLIKVLAMNLTGTGSGTDDEFAIGDKLIIDSGTGKAIKTTGTPEMEPFKVMETIGTIGGGGILEDTLVPVRMMA